MKIEVYIFANNDEKLIPYVARHYGFAKMILMENNSTDNTIKVAKEYGMEVRTYITDKFDDLILLEKKEHCWRESKADWVMVVDSDEFIYHPDLIKNLSKETATILHPKFFNMFSEAFPTTKGQIYDEVNMGTDGGMWLSKMNVFRPREIQSMNWAIGCHYAYPVGNVSINGNTELKTLHMRFLSRKYLIDRCQEQAPRMSERNHDNGWSIQMTWDAKKINEYFDQNIPNLKQII
jgi:glycosyltransferase involved in cell wall biosynthesis